MLTRILRAQYRMVQSSRSALFDYCENISAEHFLTEVAGFGNGGSMRNLIVHIASTYQNWIVRHALASDIVFAEYNNFSNLSECRELYISIDLLLDEFFERFNDDFEQEISSENNGSIRIASPLKVFTHVISHEFHHKGQVLSISRHLGYIPVDTDIIR